MGWFNHQLVSNGNFFGDFFWDSLVTFVTRTYKAGGDLYDLGGIQGSHEESPAVQMIVGPFFLVCFLFAIISGDTVDGSEIRRSPVDMANIPLFTRFSYMPGG